MRQPCRGICFRREADRGQVAQQERGAAADMHLGEHGAILDSGFRVAPDIARVVQQRDHHAEHRAPRAEPVHGRADAVVTVDQARRGERHVEGVAQVVVESVAGEIARVAAREQGFHVRESAPQRRKVLARITRSVYVEHRIAHVIGDFHVDAIGDVVFVAPLVHGGQLSPPRQGEVNRSPLRDKAHAARKNRSREAPNTSHPRGGGDPVNS